MPRFPPSTLVRRLPARRPQRLAGLCVRAGIAQPLTIGEVHDRPLIQCTTGSSATSAEEVNPRSKLIGRFLFDWVELSWYRVLRSKKRIALDRAQSREDLVRRLRTQCARQAGGTLTWTSSNRKRPIGLLRVSLVALLPVVHWIALALIISDSRRWRSSSAAVNKGGFDLQCQSVHGQLF